MVGNKTFLATIISWNYSAGNGVNTFKWKQFEVYSM